MYNFIVNYFEAPREGTPHRQHVDKLLAWWNQCVVHFYLLPLSNSWRDRQIFPTHASSASTARTSINSMAKLRAQRKRRAEIDA
jgi:hypothetical protein